MKIQQKRIANTINDENLNEKFNAEKEEVILKQMEQTVGGHVEKDIEKRVRINKMRKDRCESIKAKIVLSTVITKKVDEQSWQDRSKSKNKIEHWR